MSDTAIKVEGLGKKYRLGGAGGSKYSYKSLRDVLSGAVMAPFRRNGQEKRQTEDFWALKDVSFEVKQGEVVGIIGRNGAGKSTLLKIISRITDPSAGQVEITGRVGSLLEVGTGFHPELTGRENIYLNGAILGMRKGEIDRKFDEIVAFAETEKFLDTPVKFYSSGMYMRLAFAVAAHLEPEVLVVDEVLAVGDAAFQKKCLGKMSDVATHGRTVLFVSHSMPAILRLCPRVLYLASGRKVAFGEASTVVNDYLSQGAASMAVRAWPNSDSAPGDDTIRLAAVRVLDADGELAQSVDNQKPFTIEVEFWNLKPATEPVPNLHFFNDSGVYLFATATNHDERARKLSCGRFRANCIVPGNLLAPGRIYVQANISSIAPVHTIHLSEPDAVVFDVEDTGGARGSTSHNWPGVIRPLLSWTLDSAEPAECASQ